MTFDLYYIEMAGEHLVELRLPKTVNMRHLMINRPIRHTNDDKPCGFQDASDFGPRWTAQIPPLVDTSNPAISDRMRTPLGK